VNIAVSLAEFSMFPIERQENVDRFGADHVQFPTLHAGLSPPATSSGEIFMAPAGMDRLRQACNSRDRRRLDKECVPFCSSLALQRGHRIAAVIEVPGTPLKRCCRCRTEETSEPRDASGSAALGILGARAFQR